MMTPAETYNLVRYENFPLPQTHPSRLRALGRLSGMNPPEVENCRVLELGASEGVNLIPMAHRFRNAQFTGIDLAAEPIQRGQEFAREFGLNNLRLEVADLLAVDDSFGEFDYIIAHGLYSWTPPQVRNKILSIMGTLLAPNGIGMVSYNTLPAGHLRRMVREMMLFHARDGSSPEDHVAKARQMLALLARERTPEQIQKMDAYDTVLTAHTAELFHGRTGNQMYHDDLALVFEPVALTDFVAHARKHGLQYLDDTGTPDPRGDEVPKGLDAKTVEEVRKMAGSDRIAQLQYYDYLRMRRFRQSLVCRAQVALQSNWESANAIGLHASTQVGEVEPGSFAKGEFRMSTSHPVPLRYLRRLIALWPESERVSSEDSEVALALARAGAIDLHGAPSAAVRFLPGMRPRADPLIRFQAGRGEPRLTTPWHQALAADDGMRRLLPLLDGTRDCEVLALETGSTVEALSAEMRDLARLGVLIDDSK
jgi:SAM-dependent methyltransferase